MCFFIGQLVTSTTRWRSPHIRPILGFYQLWLTWLRPTDLSFVPLLFKWCVSLDLMRLGHFVFHLICIFFNSVVFNPCFLVPLLSSIMYYSRSYFTLIMALFPGFYVHSMSFSYGVLGVYNLVDLSWISCMKVIFKYSWLLLFHLHLIVWITDVQWCREHLCWQNYGIYLFLNLFLFFHCIILNLRGKLVFDWTFTGRSLSVWGRYLKKCFNSSHFSPDPWSFVVCNS